MLGAFHPAQLLASLPINEPADGNPPQPRSDLTFSPKFRRRPPYCEEGVLDHFVDQGVVVAPPVETGCQPDRMPVVEVAQGANPTFSNRDEDLGIGHFPIVVPSGQNGSPGQDVDEPESDIVAVMVDQTLTDWLLDSDPALRWQVE